MRAELFDKIDARFGVLQARLDALPDPRRQGFRLQGQRAAQAAAARRAIN